MRLDSKSRVLTTTVASLILAVSSTSMMPSPAMAAGTTIRAGSSTGDGYTGNFQARLLGLALVSTSVGEGSCNQSTMTGAVRSNGSALTVRTASFTNNNGPCGRNTKITITTQNMPWTGGEIKYAPVAGGRDGTLTIRNFKAKVDANKFGGITCYFAGDLVADVFNPTNENRPNLELAHQQIQVEDAVVHKASGSNFLCPSTATLTGNYEFSGQSANAIYDVPLFLTK